MKKILPFSSRKCRLSSTRCTALAVSGLVLSLACLPAFSARDGSGYLGLEFLGSTQLSRVEIEKVLALKPGATLENAQKALDRLRAKLELKHIKTNIDVVPGDQNNFFIAIDVVESGLSNKLPTRALENPHHVFLNNEKPFTLLEQLRVRQDKLIETGRPTDESYREGMKTFSDQPSQRLAEQAVKELEGQQRSLLTIVSTDPNPNRRTSAIELLNFVPDWLRSCVALIPAIDDSDAGVRAAATKFIWARLPNMPDDFPFQDLMEALSRQLMRPSHGDRTRSLACLISLCKRDSDAISAVKEFDSERLKQITDSSILPEVQAMAGQLMKVASNPPPVKRKKGEPSDLGSGF